MDCPVVCNPGLGTGHSTTITISDQTLQLDTSCNNALLVTDEPGYLDSSDPTGPAFLFTDIQDGARAQVITSVADALLHFDADSPVVQVARLIEANQNNGIVTFFYVALWDKQNSETIVDALDAIEACQPCWLPFSLVKEDSAGNAIIDTIDHDAAASWAIANDKFFSSASHDVALANPIDNTNVKGRMAALGYKTTAIEYIPAKCRSVPDPNNPGQTMAEDWFPYREVLLPQFMANVDFEFRGSPYTWAYKPSAAQWVDVPVDAIDGSTKVAVTGTFPNGSLNPANNGHANVYVSDYGNPGEWPGRTVTGHWIDEQHLLLWLKRRLRQLIATLMSNNRSIPYDDARGKALFLSTISEFMTTVYNAGWLNQDGGAFDSSYDVTGPGDAGFGLRTDDYQSVTGPRRSSRVAPPMEVCFIPAGSVHVLPINLCALADPTPVFGTQ